MKRLVLAFLLLSSPALAQQAQQPMSYTFTVTTDEANMMLNQLGKLDWTAINPLMQKLFVQIQEQNKAVQQPKPPEPGTGR